jgi:acyl carrier protein
MLDVKAQVRQFILDNFVMGSDGPSFTDSDSFMDRHLIDSTGFLELVSYLEETYGFTVEDDEMTPDHLDSLDNIDAYVRRKHAG